MNNRNDYIKQIKKKTINTLYFLKNFLKSKFSNIFLKKINIKKLVKLGKAKSLIIFEKEDFYIKQKKSITSKHSKFFKKEEFSIPEYKIYLIENGITKMGSDLVFDEKYRLIRGMEFQKSFPSYKDINLMRKIKLKYVDGTVLSLGLNGLEDNYYHCWVELAARIYAFQKSNLKIDFISLNIKKEFLKKIIELFGIDQSKILNSKDFQVIKASKIVYPQLINNWHEIYLDKYKISKKKFLPAWLNNIYKNIEVNNKKAFHDYKKVYISRHLSNIRRLINEKEFIRILKKKNFFIVNFENYSINDQISIMKNAEYIIGIHGAGMINLSFCNEGSEVLELFPENYQDTSYIIQSKLMNLKYNYYIGFKDKEIQNKNINPRDEDFFINTDEILNFMKNKWNI